MEKKSASMEDWLESLQALTDELKAIPSGAALHNQLRQLLEDRHSHQARVDHDFVIRLSYFLGTLSDKVLRTDVAALIDELMHVSESGPRVPAARRTVIHRSPQYSSHPWAAKPNTPDISDTPEIPARTPASTNVTGPPDDLDEEFIPLDADIADDSAAANEHIRHPAPKATDDSATVDEGHAEAAAEVAAEEAPTYPEVERRVNSAYRLHLDRKHGEIEKLQVLLAQKATEAMAQNKEFGALLEIERAALQQANSISEIDDMKEILIGGTDELIAGQRNLAEKLRSSFDYLKIIKSDSEHLHEELNKVRLLSLTDENTGLPNRRAFTRRLDDEIARVQRYNTSLAIALIDLDNFKEINDQYGHPAGDAVLSWYAENALPMFRHYDMVARYGGEEFAVLFPSTTLDGAQRALAKMRKHVADTWFEYDGEEILVPTFSAGLTLYKDSDTQSTLFKRADSALYRAKSLGRNRTEIDRQQPAEGNSTRER